MASSLPVVRHVLIIEPLIIVIFCTVIQNIFGVGILVFGTPILLGLDYDLMTTLGILLPSSLLVSLIQILTTKNARFPSKNSLIQSVCGVVLGALLLFYFSVPLSVYVVTAAAMLLAGGLRLNLELRDRVCHFLTQPSLNFHFINGIFHGFSNLGGILLVLRNNLGNDTKNQSLMNTASVYLIYVLSQISVLCLLGNFEIFINGLMVLPVVGLFSFVLGDRPITFLSAKFMDNALGVFFISVSAVLSYKIIQML
jgi:hypothetical protein